MKRVTRRLFEARNRGGIDAFLVGWADDVIYVIPGTGAFGGTFRERAEVRAYYDRLQALRWSASDGHRAA